MSTDTYAKPRLPDPATSPELFEHVLQRRVLAFIIDLSALVVITLGLLAVGLLAGFFTFGLAWLSLPFVIPIAILGYYAATLGSPRRATFGMAAMDLVLTPTRRRPLNGLAILIHPIVFWLSWWIAWPATLAFALFTPRQQTFHDYVAGTLMVRRSPMARHWRNAARAA